MLVDIAGSIVSHLRHYPGLRLEPDTMPEWGVGSPFSS